MLAKISLGISIILAVAVGYLLINQPKKGGSVVQSFPVLNADGANGEGGPKASIIAFVNGDSLNKHYNFIVEKSEQLEAKMKLADEKVKKEYLSRQKEWDELMAYAQSKQLPPDESQIVERRLMKLQSEIEEIQQKETGNLLKKEEELQKELQRRVSEFMESYAKERGIDYVINYQKEINLILYGNNTYDITNDVVRLLNEAYEKEKKQK